VSETSSQPPQGEPRRQDNGAPGDEPTEPMLPLPSAPALPELPPPHPGELALPPGHPAAGLPSPYPAGELALPPGHSAAALPSPSSPAVSSSPSSPASQSPSQGQRWEVLIGTVIAALLVVCALPVWFFGLWSFWVDKSHQPPPVLATLDPGGQRADDAQWSPDGRYLAEQVTLAGAKSGDPGGAAVVLWDVGARREIRRLMGADGGLALAWSPDGSWLATTDGAHVLIWLARQIEAAGASVAPTARLSVAGASGPITSLAWAKDGRTLAAADEAGLSIWQQAGAIWQQERSFKDGPCATLSCGRRLLWSPDGRWLLAAPWHGNNGASGVGVWGAQTWQSEPLLDASAPLAWSPDGALVVVRASDEATLNVVRAGSWTVAWRINPTLDLHQGYAVFPVAAGWSPDGRWLVGSAEGWVDLWPVNTRTSAWVWEAQETDQGIYVVNSLAWSPGAATLAVTTDGTARLTLYDLRNPSPPLAAPALLQGAGGSS
jgi:WD40 repeat protein